ARLPRPRPSRRAGAQPMTATPDRQARAAAQGVNLPADLDGPDLDALAGTRGRRRYVPLDLDALAAAIEAETTQPGWKTGDQVKTGEYAGSTRAVLDPTGRVRAFATNARSATEIAEGMTVLM